MMNDVTIKKHEVPDISKVTFASFNALIEIMTDKINLQKLEDYLLISNKNNIFFEIFFLKENVRVS